MRTRLTLWFAASILTILAPYLAGLLVVGWQSERTLLDHHLREDLDVALEMLVITGSELAWRADTDRDPGYDAGAQRWVEVYNLEGRPVYLRGVPGAQSIRAALGPPSRETGGFHTLQTPAGAHVRVLSALHMFGARPLWFRVARSEDGLRRDLWRMVLLLSLATPLAVLSAALAGYVISGRALSPLARITERASSIGADRLSERLPVENPNDELGQVALVFNETFARLEASFAQLKQFTADVSHELRTPLTAIRSVGEVGLREPRDAEAYREIIGSMLEETDRLSRLVETLLTLSRWESGGVRPAAEAVDLGELAWDVARHLSVLAEERRVDIDVAVREPLLVTCDPTMARQAVINVLDNAIKFTRQGGRVRISGNSTDHEHGLIVDDEGPGIPRDQRTRVLERFYRIEEGRDRGPGGAGLGLAIVQRAMAANQGRVLIESNDAGGARVILSLPRHSPQARRSS